MDDKADLRWYHYIVFALLLMVIGYVIVSCSNLFAPTARADDTTDIHFLINQYRQSQGLQPFLVDPRLSAASEAHNRWMRDNNCFAHQCPGEADPWQRIRDAGYPSPASEVIGRGYLDAARVLDGWKHSAGHNAILLGNYRDMGCHALRDAGGPWWTCDFGTAGLGSVPPPTVTPGPTPRPTVVLYPAPRWDAGKRFISFRLLAVPMSNPSAAQLVNAWARDRTNTWNNAGPGILYRDALGRMTPGNLPDGAVTADLVQGTLWTRDVDVMLYRLEQATGLRAQFGFVVWCGGAAGDACSERERGTGTEIGEGWTGLPTGVPTVTGGD